MKNIKKTLAPVGGEKQEQRIQCVVSYDVITKWDSVEHRLETVIAKTKKSLIQHLRIKNKARGIVRNVCFESEMLVA